MSEWNIIGDVAGQYRTLRHLILKMPRARVLLVGDLMDRGPNSRKVIQWAKSGEAKVLMGNHEHMMCDFILGSPGKGPYSSQDWLVNGGGATVRSYLPSASTRRGEVSYTAMQDAMKPDCEWLAKLPYFHIEPGLLVTHAPCKEDAEWLLKGKELDLDFLWYRGKPRRQDGYLQVHGHNSTQKVHWYENEPHGKWGVNIDTSRAKILTGLHWPSLQLFQKEYID